MITLNGESGGYQPFVVTVTAGSVSPIPSGNVAA